MESEEEKNENFSQVNDIKLIDFLNEEDFLVDHRFRDSLEDLRLSVTFKDISEHAKSFNRVNQLKKAKTDSIQHQTEEKLLDSGSFKPKSADASRERMTRDNAFCPSAGVQDLKGLPAIKEESKGQESIISGDGSAGSDFTFETFDGDALFLERLEDDIFDDVRASIYRSCGTPIFSSAGGDSGSGKTATPKVLSSKKVHAGSQKTRNPSANLRRQPPTIRKSKAMTASSLHSQSLQHIKGGYDSAPTGQTKRALLSYGNVKNRKTGEGLMVHKLSASVDSPGFMNFLTPPAKSSYRISRTATKSPSFARSSCDQFSSTLSSKSLSSRGTRGPGTNNSKIASSGSISKPPLGYSGRGRLSNQTSPIHLLSMSHQFNSSPASSIDRWSSQSSSSTFRATAKLRSGNSEAKLKPETNKATGSHQFTPTKMLADEHSKGAPKEVSPVPVKTPKSSKPSGLRMPSPKHGFFDEVGKSLSSFGETPKSSKPSGLRMPSPKHGFFDEVGKSLSSFGETPKSSKPSGLRMPSPRHGFFDEEKFMVRSPIDAMQFRLSPPDALSDPSANALIRTNVPGTRKKIDSPLTQSLHWTSSPRPQHSVHSKGMDNISPLSTGMRSRMKTEEKNNKSISRNMIGKEGKDQKAQNGNLLDTVKPVKKDHDADLELLVESNHHLLCESKENIEDQAKDLNIYFEVIDLEQNAIELDGLKSNAREYDESLGGVHFLSGQQQDPPSITRIPFTDKNSASYKTGSLQLSAEVARSADGVSTFPSLEENRRAGQATNSVSQHFLPPPVKGGVVEDIYKSLP